jgi:hypothetical protein
MIGNIYHSMCSQISSEPFCLANPYSARWPALSEIQGERSLCNLDHDSDPQCCAEMRKVTLSERADRMEEATRLSRIVTWVA